MSNRFELPEDLEENVDIVYLDEDEIHDLDVEKPDEEDIVEQLEDKSKVTFRKHSRSVFCVNFNSESTVAVSGGEDDLAVVWETSTGTCLLECTGHKDSVTSVCFSHDDKYVATGDMGGLIQVWDIVAKNLIWCYEGEDLEWLIWHQAAYVLISGVHTGEIYMWQIPQGNFKVFPTSGSICHCGALLPNGTHLISAYEDGSIRLWDLKSASVLSQLPSDGSGPITNLLLNSDGKLLITCGLLGRVLVVKTSDCKVVATLQAGDRVEIEAAAFCVDADLPVVATGNLNGDICIWDLGRQALRHKVSVGYSVTNMCWGLNATLLVSAVDGIIYAINGRNGAVKNTLTGHLGAVLDINISKDFKLLISSSDDMTAKVFTLENIFLST